MPITQNTREQENRLNQEDIKPPASPDDREKKYWFWLDTGYSQKLTQIRRAVEKLIKDCETTYPQPAGFTPHGTEHLASVENIIHRLIPGPAVEDLGMRERFYLLASAWVHDVGMLRGLDGDPINILELSDDEIRRTHHARAVTSITNHFSRLDVDQSDVRVLALLARFHRRAEVLENCPDKLTVENKDVKVRLLAAYLRLADALDISERRSPFSDYAICLAYNIPISSKLHWIKSRLINGVSIEPQEHRIVIDFNEPYDSDLKDEIIRHKISEKEFPLLKQNLAGLRKMVIQDLADELDSVKNTLIRGKTTYFLDICERVTQIKIDNQIFPEVFHLADNFNMISHPSATRLMYMVLRTVERILQRYHFSHGSDQQVESGTRAQKEELQIFLSDLANHVLTSRRCHIGLQKLIKELMDQCTGATNDDINNYVKQQKYAIDEERNNIRVVAGHYFDHLISDKIINVDKPELVQSMTHNLCLTSNVDDKTNNIEPDWKACVNILVYGYSELVIKALCGFRDRVITMLLEILVHDSTIKLHKINIEKIASSILRIFVCEGQPKTITAPNDALDYHDGSRYALALARRGFTNLIIIPDLVAGNLLHRTPPEGPAVHLVMLGANGLEITKTSPDRDGTITNCDRFRHSSGHMAIATLASFARREESRAALNIPRLILVLGQSKCDFIGEGTSVCDLGLGHPPSPGFKEEKDGYRFWHAAKDENIRNEPFLVRDKEVRQELHKYDVRLYNPREDAVQLKMVNDVILDFRFFTQVDESPAELRDALTNLKNPRSL